MSAWTVILDPSEEIENRAELNLNTGPISVEGIDWGDAQVQAYMADQQRWGSAPVSYRVPNRIVTIQLLLGAEANGTVASEEEVRAKLQQKVALFQREGGVLKRQREGGEAMYADIVTAVLTAPDVYGETAGIEPHVVLKLECLPDFYGAPVELDVIEGEGQIDAVLTQAGAQAVIAGDHPARAWIVLKNVSSHDQHGLLWSFRSKHYDSSPTASLVLDASRLTPINGAKEEAHVGAYEGKWVALSESSPSQWTPMLITDLVSTKSQLTHAGSYRVWARVYGATRQNVRLVWSVDDSSVQTTNAAVAPSASSSLSIIDLGIVNLSAPPSGSHWWRGIVQVLGEAGLFAVDRLWLQSLDDAAGVLVGNGIPAGASLSGSKVAGTGENNAVIYSGTAWAEPTGLTRTSGEMAKVTLSYSSKSDALLADQYGFAVPSGALVHGVEALAELVIVGEGLYHVGPTLTIHLVNEGSIIGNSGEWSESGGQLVAGGPVSSWGVSLTPAVVNSPSFGAAFHASTGSVASGSVALRNARLVVYYSYAGVEIEQDAVAYAGREALVRFDGALREDKSSTALVPVGKQTGDLVRLPPSGLEGRPVELLIKGTHGVPVTATQAGETDSTIDALSAQVFYRPTYIGRP